MKTNNVFGFIILLILIGCNNVGTDSNEIPITTSNDEALQLFLDGRDLTEKLKTPQAAKLFDKAIESDPQFALAYLYRSTSGGGYEVFRENLTKAVELSNNVSEGERHLILYNQANADNDGVKQTAELESLLKLFPEDKRVQQQAGIYYYYTIQNYDKALDHYNKSLELDPNYAPAYNNLGYLQYSMGNYTEAEQAFKNYISLMPDEANPYDSYAEFLLKQGRYDESIDQYQKAIDVDPEFVIALYGIGNNYDFKMDYENARNYFQQLFDKAQNINQKSEALFSMATSYAFEGNIPKVIETLESRAEFGKQENNPGFVFNSKLWAAGILDEKGKFEEAGKYYTEIEEFIESADLNKADLETYRVYLGLFKCSHNILKGELDKAETGLAECQTIVETRKDPSEIQTLNLFKGMFEAGRKNYKAALDYYKAADKESPYVWFYEAAAYEMDGNLEAARKCYQKVADCNDHRIDVAIIQVRAREKLS